MGTRNRTSLGEEHEPKSNGPAMHPIDSYSLVVSSSTQTDKVGRLIGQVLRKGDVLALVGTLGAGKTTLIRGVAAGLDIPSDCVSSPTFVLAHEYQGRIPLIHIDLYRVKDTQEADASGLSDCFTEETVTAVEWADRFPGWLPSDRLEIRMTHRSPASRSLTLRALGPTASSLLSRVVPLLRRPSVRNQTTVAGRKKAVQP